MQIPDSYKIFLKMCKKVVDSCPNMFVTSIAMTRKMCEKSVCERNLHSLQKGTESHLKKDSPT